MERLAQLDQKLAVDQVRLADPLLLTRLCTFSPLKWPLKPERLSPVACASLGWNCLELDTLQCDRCDRHVVHSVSFISRYICHLRAPVLDEHVTQYVQYLTSLHKPNCFWKLCSSQGIGCFVFDGSRTSLSISYLGCCVDTCFI